MTPKATYTFHEAVEDEDVKKHLNVINSKLRLGDPTLLEELLDLVRRRIIGSC